MTEELQRVSEIYKLSGYNELLIYNRSKDKWEEVIDVHRTLIGYSILDNSPQYRYLIIHGNLNYSEHTTSNTLRVRVS